MPRQTQHSLFSHPEPDESASAFVARPYISRWVDKTLIEAMEHNSGLLVAGTGSGKTPYAAMLFKAVLSGALDWKYPGRDRRGCLFLAHEGELLDQAADTFREINPGAVVAVEQGDLRAGGEADIVVASRDTLCKPERLRALGADRFQICVVDECHRYGWTSSKWRRIRSWFQCFYAGVTATPDRGDGQSLEPSFECVIDYYPMLDLINDGWLVPIHQRYEYLTDIDLDVSHRGDWTDEEIADRMGSTRPLATMVAVMRKYGCMATKFRNDRPVVGVCASPKIAEKVAEQLNAWHTKEGSGRAVYLHGRQDDKERDAANLMFKSGEARYLCIYEVGLEGYDYDEIGAVVNGRPTTKRYKIEQMAGRLVRPLKEIRDALAAAADAAERRAIIAASRKPGGLFVDLTGTQLKMTMRMASLSDVFAGRDLSNGQPDNPNDSAMEAKRKAITKSGANGVAEEMAKLLEDERARMKELIADAKRAQAEKWAALGFRVKTKFIDLNPFDLFDIRLLPSSAFNPGRAATQGQKRALERLGLERDLLLKLTRRQAKLYLEIIGNRRKAGLCTYRMAKTLRRFKYDTYCTMAEASEIIDALAANGWKRPTEPVTDSVTATTSGALA